MGKEKLDSGEFGPYNDSEKSKEDSNESATAENFKYNESENFSSALSVTQELLIADLKLLIQANDKAESVDEKIKISKLIDDRIASITEIEKKTNKESPEYKDIVEFNRMKKIRNYVGLFFSIFAFGIGSYILLTSGSNAGFFLISGGFLGVGISLVSLLKSLKQGS